MKPLADRVIVESDKILEKTTGGIYIPDDSKEKPLQGTVVAVGRGGASESTGAIIPMEVKEGDKVLYGKYSGTEIEIDGKTLLIMKECDMLAIL